MLWFDEKSKSNTTYICMYQYHHQQVATIVYRNSYYNSAEKTWSIIYSLVTFGRHWYQNLTQQHILAPKSQHHPCCHHHRCFWFFSGWLFFIKSGVSVINVVFFSCTSTQRLLLGGHRTTVISNADIYLQNELTK